MYDMFDELISEAANTPGIDWFTITPSDLLGMLGHDAAEGWLEVADSVIARQRLDNEPTLNCVLTMRSGGEYGLPLRASQAAWLTRMVAEGTGAHIPACVNGLGHTFGPGAILSMCTWPLKN